MLGMGVFTAMISWKQLLVLGVALVVILLPVAAVGFLFFPPDFAYSHSSTYSYTTSISTNTTLQNVTVHLPFPTGADVDRTPRRTCGFTTTTAGK
jgi:hypothetical protein